MMYKTPVAIGSSPPASEEAMNTAARLSTCLIASMLMISLASGTARAEGETYPPDGDHPLRILDYFVAPVGTALEWTVTRPLWHFGRVVAPYQHIDYKGFRGCSKERPARSCTNVIK
jgi:hypothetical protein